MKEIVNPLLDSTLVQLTAIRNILEGDPAAMLIEAAKAQITAVKGILNPHDRKMLTASAETAITGYTDPPKKNWAQPVPTEKAPKPRSPYPTKGSKVIALQLKAIVAVLQKAEAPMRRTEITEQINSNAKKWGVNPKTSQAVWKTRLTALVKEGRIIRTGSTSSVRYTLAK